MDSPTNEKTGTNDEPANSDFTCADSPQVQESPYSNYLNNLSPLELKKASNVTQSFAGINSPPIVFTSPRIKLPCDDHRLKRPQVLELPMDALPQHNVSQKSHRDDPRKSDPVFVNDEDFVAKDFAETQTSNSLGSIDEFLVDPHPVMVDSANFTFSIDAHENEVDSSSANDAIPSENVAPHFQQNTDVNALSDASVDHILHIRQSQDLASRRGGASNEDKSENAIQSISGSSSKVNAYQDCDRNAETALSHIASRHDKHNQVIRKQHGLLRRCLFDEARRDDSPSRSFSSSASNMTNLGSSTTPPKLERLNLRRASSSSISKQNKVIEQSNRVASNVPPRTVSNFPVLASRPLSIGLHLNSIVGGQSIGNSATPSASSQGTTTPFETHHLSISTKGCSDVKKVKDCAKESIHHIGTSIIHTTTAESSENIEPQDLLMKFDHCAEGSQYDIDTSVIHTSTGKFSSEQADSPDEINQMSPKKRRKRESSGSASDGSKRCNCKKSKCLKMYCDCFTAGLYCSELCACQGCFNRSEYEDKVLDTRRQIESRNPNAFSSKIVESINPCPENNAETENSLAPSLARHKKGCNCRRSMCLKRYCECFQANVGCSDHCRCEGCQNFYGTKQGYGLSKPLLSNAVGDGSSEEDKFMPLAVNDGPFLTELDDPLNLTPLTPLLQFSDHDQGPPGLRVSHPGLLPSPDSAVAALSLAESKPTGNTDSNTMQVIGNKETPESGIHNSKVVPNSQMVDGFSRRRDSLLNLSHLTPSLSRPVATSSSPLSSSSSIASSKARNPLLTLSSRIVLVSKSAEQSSLSPITPITSLLSNKSGKNLDSGAGISEILEDETPEILKEASTPTNPVKVTSPNKKRVSPPHSGAGSNSLVGLKSGRKFVLKAVPSFPPLTPCIEPRGSKNPDTSDLQDEGRDK